MVGETLECAAWFDPSKDASEQAARMWLRDAMNGEQLERGVILGEFRWEVLSPGDPRVPKPSKKAVNGVKLLHLEADIVSYAQGRKRFSEDLEYLDLMTLRKLTRNAAAKNGVTLTDEECDQTIDHLGPEVGNSMLEAAISRLN